MAVSHQMGVAFAHKAISLISIPMEAHNVLVSSFWK